VSSAEAAATRRRSATGLFPGAPLTPALYQGKQVRGEQPARRSRQGSGVSDNDEYRQLVKAALAPFASEVDAWERGGHLPRSLFRALGEAGAFRQRWQRGPVEGHPLARILVEELIAVNGGAALAVSIHSEVFVHALVRFGGEKYEDLLTDALAGSAIGCFAATEATGGSDLGALRATASEDKAGWRLRAEKRYTTNAGAATHVLILANSQIGRRGPSLFCLPMTRPGVEVRGYFETLGVRSADTSALSIDAAIGPADVVGRLGTGMRIALLLLDFERLAGAAGTLSGAETALRLARAWARRRSQFGARLIDHQALRHRLADRWADLYAARAALDRTCQRLAGEQVPHVEIAATKLFAVRAASLAVDEVLQIFGARGYTAAYPLERMYRDVRLTRIGGGTDEMMRDIVASHLDCSDAEADEWLDVLEKEDSPRPEHRGCDDRTGSRARAEVVGGPHHLESAQ
jgi:alkylation response protein AidB-like acyl-CoA dehydrogenase